MGYISGGNKSIVIGILGVFVCEGVRGTESPYLYLSGQRESRVLQRFNVSP